jgi:(R,R)-butanediol dehydrogenase/meso-butanediol dehydrogenase/diacetyl reductase
VKALVWREGVGLEDWEEPKAAEGEVLVRVGAAAICGTDLTILSGKHPRARPPRILGHEFMGTVAGLAGGPDRGLVIGARVVVEPLLSCKTCVPCLAGYEHVCRNLRLLGIEADGGFAEYVCAPAERVYAIPDTLSDEEASMIEPTAVAVHSISYGDLSGSERVAVIGAGPVGLLIAQIARALGVENLWMFETDPFRLELAGRLGFHATHAEKEDAVEAVLTFTHGEGADVTFDAAGVPASGAQVIPMTGIRGRIVMVAIHKRPCEVAFRDLSYREQVILGVRVYAKGDFARAIELVSSGKVKLKPLVTQVFSLGDGVRAFDLARRGGESCKIVLKP